MNLISLRHLLRCFGPAATLETVLYDAETRTANMPGRGTVWEQNESGTWAEKPCDICHGSGMVDKIWDKTVSIEGYPAFVHCPKCTP